MNWTCLFAVETGSHAWLIYGYATPASGLIPSLWFEQALGIGHPSWRLLRYCRAASDQDLDALQASFSSGATTRLELRGNHQVELNHGPLLRRPAVYAVPRVFEPSGTPVSLSDQLARTVALWQIAPEALFDAAFPPAALAPGERQEALFRILDALQRETGIEFLGRDSARLGNFEVIRYLAGSYDIPDGLHTVPKVGDPSTPEGTAQRSLVVWIEPPLADCGALRVGCKLFNGHPDLLRTLVLDEVRAWPAQAGGPLRFTPGELFSSYELSVWAEDGRLVGRKEHSVLRGIDLEMRVADASRGVRTAWDERLPEHLRRLVAESTAWSARHLNSGDYPDDPWVLATDRKRVLLQGLVPGTGVSEFFDATHDEHVRAILFLAGLLRRRGLRRAVVADPYLDRSGVESLLVRALDVDELVLLASHRRPRPDASPVATADLPGAEGLSDGLVEACETYRDRLPPRVRVLNVENANGEGQQFHDRSLLIETDAGTEVWVLTNSLSMVARRYPLVITRLDDAAARRFANYVDSLERGTVSGRPEVRTVELWAKPAAAALSPAGPAPPEVGPPAPDWRSVVLGLLVLDTPAGERLARALERGLLEPGVVPGKTTWRVPPSARESVTIAIRDQVQASREDAPAILRTLALWAYNGGPAPDAYRFGAWVAEADLVAIGNCLGDSPAAPAAPLPESLDPVRRYLAHNAPGNMVGGAAPEVDFHAQLLWPLVPARLLDLLERTQGADLFDWLCANAHSLSPDQRLALLGSRLGRVQAVGVLTLWDRDYAAPRSVLSVEDRLARLAAEMAGARVPSLEAFLCLAILATTEARTEVQLQTVAALAVRYLRGALDTATRERVVAVLGKPHPLHTLVRVSALAAECQAAGGAELDRWCFSELLRRLPRRGHPPPPEESAALRIGDPAVADAVARSVSRFYGGVATQEVVEQVLNALNCHGANAPLYPTRDFAAWNRHLDGVLCGLQFGLRFVRAAPEPQRDALQAVVPAVLTRLAELRLGLWHRYLDAHDLLGEVLDTLAEWMDGAVTTRDREAFVNLIGNSDMPGILRLRAFLGSVELARGQRAALPALAANPGSAPSMCSPLRSGSARGAILGHLARLRSSAPDLSDVLDQVEAAFNGWMQERYPPPD